MRIPKQAKKVALGLSGGVDSAVSALLLQQAGYDVTGVFLECYNTPGCRTDADHQDALEVALSLQLPFRVLDFKKAYQDTVIAYFRDAYKAGFTPNPDVVCNREIKFGLFYDWAMQAGYDYVATGHYARVERGASSDERRNSSSEFGVRNQAHNQEITSPHISYAKLLQGVDKTKDQSYFLCQLSSEQLEHILFPLGHLTKSEVREFAQKHSLPVAQKADSQGICFIGEVSVKAFLISLGLKEKPGDVLFEDVAGTAHAIGTHDGAWFYTLGQRLGLNKRASKESIEAAGLDPSHLPPLFVLAKDMESNQLVVGLREHLYANQFNVGEIHWLDKRHESGSMNQELRVRIRHQGELVDATIETHTSNNIVHASQPLFGVAPGQIAVFYQDDVLVGWAEIQ
jgi:tRNA-specific 2-thiouridylase